MPPGATGMTSLGAETLLPEAALYPGDRGRVYVTKDRAFARMYAAKVDGQGGGTLYRVEPLGRLADDPDGVPESRLNFQCPAARVLAVVERDLYLSPLDHQRAMAPHMQWVDGSPAIDRADGQWLPPRDPARRSPELLAELAHSNRRHQQAQAAWQASRG